MSRTSQTDSQKVAANAADNFLIDSLQYYREHGVPERADIKAETDIAKRMVKVQKVRGLCDAWVTTIRRRIDTRKNGKPSGSITSAFME